MIYLTKNVIDAYIGMDKRLDQAFRMICDNEAVLLPPGRYDANDGMYFMCQKYAPKELADTLWETHIRYIDVQYVVAGGERLSVPIEFLLVIGSKCFN